MTYGKNLTEMALSLDEIEAESSYEKFIRHGHSSTLHLGWVRTTSYNIRALRDSRNALLFEP